MCAWMRKKKGTGGHVVMTLSFLRTSVLVWKRFRSGVPREKTVK